MSELEEEVKRLSYGYTDLNSQIEDILTAVITHLESERVITVNNMIIMPNQVNIGATQRIAAQFADSNTSAQRIPRDIFDGMDEEIVRAKAETNERGAN